MSISDWDISVNVGDPDTFAISLVGLPYPELATAPRNVELTSYFNAIKVSWNTPVFDGDSDIIGYKIYRSSSFLGLWGWEEIAQVDGDTYSYTDSGLSSKTYYYQVRAITSEGAGLKSVKVSGKPYVFIYPYTRFNLT